MTPTDKPRLAGILGWPVAHSKSPALHNFWLRTHGIDGTYVRLPTRPENLAATLRELAGHGFAGVNLTVPHKEAALALVDEVTPQGRRIGAINTIFVQPNGRLSATNTDAYGFFANLRSGAPGFDPAAGAALVLGAGGAARAVCVALQDAGAPEIRVANRTQSRADALVRDLGAPLIAIPWSDRGDLRDVALLVNTTTLGMSGQLPLDLDLAELPTTAVVSDIVYAPLQTPLLKDAAARGNPTVDGLGMLLYQAQAGFEGWFGVRPDVTPALRAHVLAVD